MATACGGGSTNDLGLFWSSTPHPRVEMKVHRWTLDVLAVVALTLLADLLVLVLDVPWTPVRVAVMLPLVLFLPGYVLLGVLYPRGSANGSRPDSTKRNRSGNRSIDGVERAGLSLAASLAILPLLAFALNFTPSGIRTVPVLLALSWFTYIFAFLTFVRRLGVDADHRFHVPPLSSIGTGTSRYLGVGAGSLASRRPFESTTPTHRLLNVLLLCSVLVLVASVGYAAVTPPPYEASFTEYYLVTEDGDGDYVTTGQPRELAAGEGTAYTVAIENHEGEETTYTTVVKLVDASGGGGEVGRAETQVAPGETRITEVTVTPDRGGEDLRLVFLLYPDEVPADPTTENAYRNARLHVTVTGGSG